MAAVVTRIILVGGVLGTLFAALPIAFLTPAASAVDVPLWERTTYRRPGADRSFRCDLVQHQALAPHVVVYGGSRGQRMPPAAIRRRTGLSAFNAAMHNGRPEDGWAFTSYLLARRPDRPPCVVWCVQVTTFSSARLHPGLVLDPRLARAFPASLIEAETAWARQRDTFNLLAGRRFSRYGMMLRSGYDRRREAGVPLRRILSGYLQNGMLAKAGDGEVPRDTREMAYFEQTLALLNRHGVQPLIVIMPYHPRVVRAFFAVGWDAKYHWLQDYLAELGARHRIRVLDCLRIGTWGGTADGFFDGSHMTIGNSARLLRYCIREAPECFTLHPEWAAPSGSAPDAWEPGATE